MAIVCKGRFRLRPIEIMATQIEEEDTIRTSDGEFPVEPGDWIIRDEEGNIAPMCDEDFRGLYEPINDAGKEMFNTQYRVVKEKINVDSNQEQTTGPTEKA